MVYDRILQPFQRLVEQFTKRIDYLAQYPCKVITQNVDGTLDIQPEDARIPGMQSVPYKAGAGQQATFSLGARVYLMWENGNPAAPIICGYDSSVPGVTSVSFFAPLPAGNIAPPLSVPPVPLGISSPTFGFLVRVGDLVQPSAAMTTWMATISAALETAPPIGPIGYSSTGSKKVQSS